MYVICIFYIVYGPMNTDSAKTAILLFLFFIWFAKNSAIYLFIVFILLSFIILLTFIVMK